MTQLQDMRLQLNRIKTKTDYLRDCQALLFVVPVISLIAIIFYACKFDKHRRRNTQYFDFILECHFKCKVKMNLIHVIGQSDLSDWTMKKAKALENKHSN